MECVDFLVVGCGPAGGIAAREAARAGLETLVLEKDPVVGEKRVCAAGLRPGFCQEFDLPTEILHCNPPTIALHSPSGKRYEFAVVPPNKNGPATATTHTTTREQLDGTIARLAAREGATIRSGALLRSMHADGAATIVEYADLRAGERRRVRARGVFLATGSTARLDDDPRFRHPGWNAGLITCYQYRVYLDRPAVPQTYQTLEMHYYRGAGGRPVIGWMFPKVDHLAIGLGIQAKVPGAALRRELDALVARVAARLFPQASYTIREEGNLLYGGAPRPGIAAGNVLVGGTAAGLVDATTGEGIHEAASSGRFAARAMDEARRSGGPAGPRYERLTKGAFYSRLRHRHKLMTFLERRPERFDVLFRQLCDSPAFAEMLQQDRHDFTWREWLYLYAQAAAFSLRALRV